MMTQAFSTLSQVNLLSLLLLLLSSLPYLFFLAMADEVIDLTGSPPPQPPPPRSPEPTRILRLTSSASTRRIQFKIKKTSLPSWANQNPNLYLNQQLAPWVPGNSSGQTYEFSQIIGSLQSTMHGDQAAPPAVYEPVAASNAYLFPQGSKLREPWTPQEHEQFLMGLVKYGRGRWTKIARHFVWNKTPQQVQSYAASFFRHLPTTCLYSFRKKNSTCATFINGNFMGASASASASYSQPMIDMGPPPPPPPTLILFPVQPHLPIEEASSSSAFAGMETGGAATSMPASGEVDLVLRLG